MKTVHVVPSDSAGGSLRVAIRDGGQDDDVGSFLDDLSCGPIATGESSERAQWWAPFYGDRESEAELKSFWDRVAATGDQLTVWFSRDCASGPYIQVGDRMPLARLVVLVEDGKLLADADPWEEMCSCRVRLPS